MSTLRIKQVRSNIGSTKRQKETLVALGLTKIDKTVELKATDQVKGMIEKVKHLVKVETV